VTEPTINGNPLLTAVIRMPRVGAWTADVSSRGAAALSGRVTITIDGIDFVGTIVRSALSGPNRVESNVVGGAGGLGAQVTPRNYSQGPAALLVAKDAIAFGGEELSQEAESYLSRRLQRWQRSAGTVSQALDALAESLGASWRTLQSGLLWLGVEEWPEFDVEHTVIDDDQQTGSITVAPVAPSITPGVTFSGRQARLVEHVLDANGLRTEISTTGPADALKSFLGPVERRILYSRVYPARVVKQNGDGTLQVMPDDAAFKGAGLDRVPIRLGVPGSVQIPAGARVGVEFEGGDPQRPIASWFHGEQLELLKLGNGADFVALAAKVLTELQAIKSWADAHVHPTGVGPSGPPAAPLPPPGSVAASRVKAE
jgi:hypothetical protein